MTGQRFGRLTVVERVPSRAEAHWRCLCDCGNTSVLRGSILRDGQVRSCGCYLRDRLRRVNTVHGQAVRGHMTPTYNSWMQMRRRCRDPKHGQWANYGGRGITVCDRWRDSFANFLADMGERPDGTSIDRIDNDGNYEPGNCRWATPLEQSHNKRNTRAA